MKRRGHFRREEGEGEGEGEVTSQHAKWRLDVRTDIRHEEAKQILREGKYVPILKEPKSDRVHGLIYNPRDNQYYILVFDEKDNFLITVMPAGMKKYGINGINFEAFNEARRLAGCDSAASRGDAVAGAGNETACETAGKTAPETVEEKISFLGDFVHRQDTSKKTVTMKIESFSALRYDSDWRKVLDSKEGSQRLFRRIRIETEGGSWILVAAYAQLGAKGEKVKIKLPGGFYK